MLAIQSWQLIAGPAVGDARSPGCHPPFGSSVLLRVRGGEVFESFDVGYLCSTETGRVVRLEVTEHFSWPIAVFARNWGALYSTANDAPWAVTVYDMRTGRTRFEDNDIGKVDRIVLAPDGAVAWVDDNSETDAPQPTVFRVLEHNRYGTFTLDRSPTIAPSTLQRSGSTVRWRDGLGRRSAPLR
jgi:hypothetical protein